MQVLEDIRPVAKVTHRCEVCSGYIAEGDRYHRQRSVDGGDAFTWKAHGLCSAAYFVVVREEGLNTSWEEYPDEHDVLAVVLRFFENWVAL